jgi:hypothetical protein
MQSPRSSVRQTLRHIALTIALILGSFTALAGISDASASTLIAFVDAGGSGDDGGIASERAPFVVTGNVRSIALIESNDPANAGIAFVTPTPATTGEVAVAGLDHTGINFCIPCDGLA